MIRRIFSYMGKYKKYGVAAVICVVTESIFELLIPLIMADIVDVGVANGDKAYIFAKGGQMLLWPWCWASEALVLVHCADRGWGPGSEKKNIENFSHFHLPILTISESRHW